MPPVPLSSVRSPIAVGTARLPTTSVPSSVVPKVVLPAVTFASSVSLRFQPPVAVPRDRSVPFEAKSVTVPVPAPTDSASCTSTEEVMATLPPVVVRPDAEVEPSRKSVTVPTVVALLPPRPRLISPVVCAATVPMRLALVRARSLALSTNSESAWIAPVWERS